MWHVLVAGSLFFPGLYVLCSRCARRARPEWTEAECSLISARIVSSIQGILAASSGFIIITSCKDVKFERHWLATWYIWFIIPYMVYDTYVMYVRHWYKCREQRILNGKEHFSRAMNSFIQKDFLMLVHHTVILTILVPIGLFLRQDKGDFFVGCLFIAEMSTPFVSLGKVLIQLNLQNSLLHKVNGAFVLLTFFMCRILLFPFMYSAYGKQYGIPLYKVPLNIPVHCNVINATMLAPQIYWFWLICRKALRLYTNSPLRKDR
ncbi:TLC domain-containing protein 3A [Spea bombifrons]|uniref:TLC domain-containing protein 3A n=1 Tax=Spea bombifrons TaxID=233779 RepID=UPI00234B1184|nr:TLC domain-containing protein 3A [Spea bombifrons]